MKEKNNLSDLTLEELHTRQKKLKGVIIGIGIVMAIALIILIYLSVKGKNYALLALIFVLPVTLLPNFIYLSQLSKETKSRNQR